MAMTVALSMWHAPAGTTVGTTSVAMLLLAGSGELEVSKQRAFVLLRRASYFSFACPKEK
jgi:hypothetical protein